MPALPNVPKVIRLDFAQSYAGSPNIRDRVFIQYTGTLSAGDLATFLATFSASWNTNIAPLLNANHALSSITGTDLTTPSSPQAINSTARAGTNAAAAMAAGVALVVKFKINRRYRGGHPRFYFTGLAQSQMSTAVLWSAATITSFGQGFANFINGGLLAPPAAMGVVTHVSVSFFAGFTNKTFPSGRTRPVATVRGTPVVDAVQSYNVNPKIASQRRRNLQSP